jgi:hypothetical protein
MWDEVGMATRPEAAYVRDLPGCHLMPTREGAGHVIEELRTGVPAGEVVITEWNYCKLFFPMEEWLAPASAAAGEPAAEAARPADDGPKKSPPDRPAAPQRPLLDRIAERAAGARVVAEVRLDPAADPFLVQHRFRTRPMLPLVIALEAMAEAAASVADEGLPRLVLRQIEIVNPLRFLSDEPQTARAIAESTPQGIACRLVTDFHNRRGQLVQKDRPHFRALAESGEAAPAPTPAFPASLAWQDTWYPEDDQVIHHGPAFRRLSQLVGCTDGRWYGKISAGATGDLGGPRRRGKFLLPAAALDACFFACGIYVWYQIDRRLISIPEGMDRVRLWRAARAGEACVVQLRLNSFERQRGSFDFVLFGEDESAILEVNGYRNINAASAAK